MLLAVTLLSAACWLYVGFAWGSQGSLALFGLALGFWIVCGLGVAASVWVLRRASAGVWIAAGLLVLASLLLTTSLFFDGFPENLPELLAITLLLSPALLSTLALVIAAMLLYTGLNAYQVWRQASAEQVGRSKQAGRAALLALTLGALLLVKALHNLYWLLIWDSTTDSLDIFWLVLPVLGALFAGLVLLAVLPGKWRLAGVAYALLAPALVIAVFTLTQRVDFYRLTEARAGQISRAVESYHAREGRYPSDLRQLTPRYLLSIPAPVIIYGQDWCYEGSADSYALGYVYREHWSSPYLVGRTHKAVGETLNPESICQEEIAALRESKPGYYLANGE